MSTHNIAVDLVDNAITKIEDIESRILNLNFDTSQQAKINQLQLEEIKIQLDGNQEYRWGIHSFKMCPTQKIYVDIQGGHK